MTPNQSSLLSHCRQKSNGVEASHCAENSPIISQTLLNLGNQTSRESDPWIRPAGVCGYCRQPHPRSFTPPRDLIQIVQHKI